MRIEPETPDSGALRLRRCLQHKEREAAARCTSCGGHFCRECAVEHEGEILCPLCLPKTTLQEPGRKMASGLAKGAAFVSAFLFLWLFFYLCGIGLLRIPSSFHEGDIWASLPWRP